MGNSFTKTVVVGVVFSLTIAETPLEAPFTGVDAFKKLKETKNGGDDYPARIKNQDYDAFQKQWSQARDDSDHPRGQEYYTFTGWHLHQGSTDKAVVMTSENPALDKHTDEKKKYRIMNPFKISLDRSKSTCALNCTKTVREQERKYRATDSFQDRFRLDPNLAPNVKRLSWKQAFTKAGGAAVTGGEHNCGKCTDVHAAHFFPNCYRGARFEKLHGGKGPKKYTVTLRLKCIATTDAGRELCNNTYLGVQTTDVTQNAQHGEDRKTGNNPEDAEDGLSLRPATKLSRYTRTAADRRGEGDGDGTLKF
jgi:hypothetical protein